MRRILVPYQDIGNSLNFHGRVLRLKYYATGQNRRIASRRMAGHDMTPNIPNPFDPPLSRSMQVLDRSVFEKKLAITAATVFDDENLSKIRDKLRKSGNLLIFANIRNIQPDATVPGRKCILLMPGIEFVDPMTWPTVITELVENKLVGLRPFELTLTYNDWNMSQILDAIIPESSPEEKETPTAFAVAGHVAHLNLRDNYLPFKHVIGQVLLDKNPKIRTVINKTEDVGSHNVFRTFPYEVLAGPDDLDVQVSFAKCQFTFNFGRVYWNQRLNTEHERMATIFREGEAVCDVMAGVGPFSIVAGKKNVFAFANDLNPDSYAALQWAVDKNKVGQFVVTACSDGRDFIRQSSEKLWTEGYEVALSKRPKNSGSGVPVVNRILKRPRVFDHFVMNLPASAVEFLDAFRGLYAGRAESFRNSHLKLPLVHVYCFSAEHKGNETEEREEVCSLVSKHLGHHIRPQDPDTEINFVRKVSPKKQMFRASFRLPPEIAFAE